MMRKATLLILLHLPSGKPWLFEDNDRDSLADVLANGGWTPTERSFLPITKDKMELLAHAAKQNDVIHTLELGTEEYAATAEHVEIYEFHGGTDRMFLEEHKGKYCMVTWMGTRADNDQDVDQNLNYKPLAIQTTNGGCEVNEGFWQAYSGSGNGYNANFEPILTEFIEHCDAGGKQIVFNGHSQGGAAATVAHLIWADYKPITTSFGGPPIFKKEGGCGVIPDHDIWRVINSENRVKWSGKKLVYDAVANLNLVDFLGFVGYHVGGYIILPPGDQEANIIPWQDSVAYFGPDKPDMDVGLLNLDFNDEYSKIGSTHQTWAYRKKMESLYEDLQDGEELDVEGFVDGTICYHDKECFSFNVLDAGGCSTFGNICSGE